MLTTIKFLLLKLWYGWNAIFNDVPYGNPYLSTVTLFLIIVVMTTYFFKEPVS